MMIEKEDLIKNMYLRPFRYHREQVYEYLSRGVLTKEECIQEGLLTEEAYNHILSFPSIFGEQENPPLCPIFGERIDLPGCVDVLPLGLPGSGGKTCLLASLMTLLDNDTFVIDHSGQMNGGEEYALQLKRYMDRECIPLLTAPRDIWPIYTMLACRTRLQKVAFWEFTCQWAIDLIHNTSAEEFAPDFLVLNRLFKNKNKKILFFCIGVEKLRIFKLYDTCGCLSLSHSDVFEILASLLEKDSDFCKKLVGIHVVVTKSDVLPFGIHVDEWLLKQGYGLFLERLKRICLKYGIMNRNGFKPDIIPFSLGKFMIGDIFHFDSTDAQKVLEIIRSDIDYDYKQSTKFTSIIKGIIEKVRGS